MPQKRSEKEQFIQCNLTVYFIKTSAMASWDITSLGIQIPIFKATRRVTNNYVEQIIYVVQLNEFIAKDVFQILDPVKLM